MVMLSYNKVRLCLAIDWRGLSRLQSKGLLRFGPELPTGANSSRLVFLTHGPSEFREGGRVHQGRSRTEVSGEFSRASRKGPGGTPDRPGTQLRPLASSPARLWASL